MKARYKSLIIAILLLSYFYAVASFTGKTGGTGSMYPLVKGGELLIFNPYFDKNADLTGKIISFYTQGRDYRIMHRVVEDDGNSIYTKGDANGYIDPWITKKEDIYAEVVLILPNYFCFVMASIAGFIVGFGGIWIAKDWS